MNVSNITTPTFTEAQRVTIKATFVTFSSISCCLCILFIIYVIIKTVRSRIFFRFMSVRILTYIEVCVLFAAISDFYSLGVKSGDNSPLCILEGFQTQFFSLSQGLWNLCLSIFMLLTIVFGVKSKIW